MLPALDCIAAQYGALVAYMSKIKAPQVQIGECFCKANEPHGKIWVVIDLRVATDGILHAQLRESGCKAGSMTIAAGVLVDPRFWKTVRSPE